MYDPWGALTPAVLVVLVWLVVAMGLVVLGPEPRARLRPAVRLAIAVGGTAGVVAVPVAWWTDDPRHGVLVGAVVAWSFLPWGWVRRDWTLAGTVAWVLSVDATVLYLAAVLRWTLTADLGPWTTAASLALWCVEVFVALIGLACAWELVDVTARHRWRPTRDPRQLRRDGRPVRPFVSIHVPTHQEPPEMVIETLQRLVDLDYDDYEVLLVDNNTTDPALWRPVQSWCDRQDRVTFVHLENWPGYKSGALNHALTRTDDRAEVIGVVDADYLVDPDFLTDCAPWFGFSDVSFVQTPQDYRGSGASSYFRRLHHSYAYFFSVSQRSRNERNGAIFGGTMGLVRRSELEAAGGWDEWCITEDAELSLRLLRRGGRGVHLDRAYGQGVMPLTFESLKRQRYRWCFGGVQILRMHGRSLLPGPRSATNRLTPAQRWAYVSGGLQWLGDLAALAFLGFLSIAAVDLATGGDLLVRRLSGVLLAAVVAVVAIGSLRAIASVRRVGRTSWRDSVGVFGLWLALGITVARASARAAVAREGVFLRTPKVRAGTFGVARALRHNTLECIVAGWCVVMAALASTHASGGAALVAGLLLLQGAGHAAAPFNSIAAQRSHLPPSVAPRHRSIARRRRLVPVVRGERP
ncbi:glycosyltransferase, group 2 family protein [Aeromicrobium marinum DSM 15272]|uniref:Beta-monoglucosyldiacylglycerol synthase n=1 Tax=Aeromicrobium marinum DSM 15272 TaxID=585531 RepID=E2S9T3_9ACTN|nr:glycosyltransferase [Aeromicrobium marinum]EFQ84007.1 glycosyltransferase, group 2 family protein [Aeromicrobium marinum DSM 15272]